MIGINCIYYYPFLILKDQYIMTHKSEPIWFSLTFKPSYRFFGQLALKVVLSSFGSDLTRIILLNSKIIICSLSVLNIDTFPMLMIHFMIFSTFIYLFWVSNGRVCLAIRHGLFQNVLHFFRIWTIKILKCR